MFVNDTGFWPVLVLLGSSSSSVLYIVTHVVEQPAHD